MLQIHWFWAADRQEMSSFWSPRIITFSAAIIWNIQDIVNCCPPSAGKKKKKIKLTDWSHKGNLLFCLCVSHWPCLHVLACALAWRRPARLRLLLVIGGKLIFFSLPLCFSLGFWQNHSAMETKKLLCDRGKPFISGGVNGGVLLITAWVITHTLADTHTF